MFDLGKAAEAQKRLSAKLKLEWDNSNLSMIGGADCTYDWKSRKIGALVVVCKFPGFEVIETSLEIRLVEVPYIPGFLNFREGPAFLKAFHKLKNRPDVTLVDGNGIAHPRRMGLASYVGVIMDIRTIGCAKKPLFRFAMPGIHRGDFTFFNNNRKEKVGFCLRTRSGVKPIFVSPGHKIDFKTSKSTVLSCSKYRIPEPIRMAHRLAKEIF